MSLVFGLNLANRCIRRPRLSTTVSTMHTGADHLNQALFYHEQTKHHLTRYARGPHGLDWVNQPNPFLRYPSSLLPLLHFNPGTASPRYSSLFHSNFAANPQPLTYTILSQLLFDSLSLSAWKSAGSSTWSLRVNPSSGNLHPTECYIISSNLPKEESTIDLCPSFFDSPFVAHYAPKEHGLELRCCIPDEIFSKFGLDEYGGFIVGFSSIFWREAWKYGERGFRYCNHDVGHAIGAFAIAAAAVGWDVKILDGLGQEDLGILFGIGAGFNGEAPVKSIPSRPTKGKMPWIELEHPDCALLVFPSTPIKEAAVVSSSLPEINVNYAKLSSEISKLHTLKWFGKPNPLSNNHLCWDIIYKTAHAVEKPPTPDDQFTINPLRGSELILGASHIYKDFTVREVIRKRRSAVDMDGVHIMGRETFYQILLHCLPSGDENKQGKQFTLPFRALPWDSQVHAVLFVHRVAELPMGIYFLVRNDDHFESLKQAMRTEFEWDKPEACPVGLPLYRLVKGDFRKLSKQLSCHQVWIVFFYYHFHFDGQLILVF